MVSQNDKPVQVSGKPESDTLWMMPAWAQGAVTWVEQRGTLLYTLALVIVLLLAAFLRFYNLSYMAPVGDELSYVRSAMTIVETGRIPPGDYMATARIAVVGLIAVVQMVGVEPLLAGRLVSAAFGFLLIPLGMMITWQLYRRRLAAVAVGLWLAGSSWFVLISRETIADMPVMFWILLAYLFVIVAEVKGKGRRWYALAGLALVIGLHTKAEACLAVPVVLLYLAYRTWPDWRRLVLGKLLPLGVPLMLYPIPLLLIRPDMEIYASDAIWYAPRLLAGLRMWQAKVINVAIAWTGIGMPNGFVTLLVAGIALVAVLVRVAEALRFRRVDSLLAFHVLIYSAGLAVVADNMINRYLFFWLPAAILLSNYLVFGPTDEGALAALSVSLPNRRRVIRRLRTDLANVFHVFSQIRRVVPWLLALTILTLPVTHARMNLNWLTTKGWDYPQYAAVVEYLRSTPGDVHILSGQLLSLNYLLRQTMTEVAYYPDSTSYLYLPHELAAAVFERSAATSGLQASRVETRYVLSKSPTEFLANLQWADMVVFKDPNWEAVRSRINSLYGTETLALADRILSGEFLEPQQTGMFVILTRR